jgi:DnaJ-class molecular chaperone
MKDLYKILGVSEDADADAIKKRYRKLAKEFHPDATGGDKKKTERFKEIGEAYGILGDEKKRQEYDRLKHLPVGADGMPQGFDPEAFAQAFGGAGGFRGGNVHVSSDFGDLGDIFSSLFGGGGGGGMGGNPFGGARVRTRTARGQDMMGRLELGFAEAALGARKSVRTGSGTQIDVQVPPGVETGARVRLAGQGGAAPKGGHPGDLHLEIVVTPDPHLRREGEDIEADLPLSVAEAILGTKVNVPTVDGSVLLTIPPGTSSGAKLRLRGKGAKRADGSRGDQICYVQVVVPKVTADDADTRKLVEELDRRTKGTKVRDF